MVDAQKDGCPAWCNEMQGSFTFGGKGYIIAGMEITYDYYRIFYYVAKYKSFSQAAKVLMSNQPNITKFMNNLEAQLGCRLLIRSRKGVALTPEGEKLYAHVAVAYEQLKTAEAELALDKGLQSGIVTVGASEMALHGVMLPVLRRFRECYPGIRLRISNDSTPQAMKNLQSGAVDFAVVTSPAEMEKPFRSTCIKTFQEILIGSSRYGFLAEEPRHLAELLEYPLVCLGRNTKTYEFYAKVYQEHGLVLNPDTEVATADLLLPMIVNHLGIGFVPEEFVQDAVEKGEAVVIPLAEKIPKREICLIEDGENHLSIAASTLRNMIIAAGDGGKKNI